METIKMKWCLADAFALALDEKEEHPKRDFSKLVDKYWSMMQKENEKEELECQ